MTDPLAPSVPGTEDRLIPDGSRFVLVLGGGNALGAYHAGLYEALHAAGLEPDWVIGTSIGALTAAIIAGNPPSDRVARLRELWRPEDERARWPMPWDAVPDSWRRTGAVIETLVAGRPGLFGPLGSPLAWSLADAGGGTPALYDTQTLDRSLAALVDFDRLNRGGTRFTAAAVDIETGAEVLLDSARQTIGPDHVRASAALLTTFPAITVDGRLLGDGGLAMNLPLDPVMTDDCDAPTLCIAADLLPLAAARPHTLGEVVSRMQDLTFAAQSARTLARWEAQLGPGSGAGRDRSIALAIATYSDQAREVAGKAMDFSPRSVGGRWRCGQADGRALVDRVRSGEIVIGEPGLRVHRNKAAQGRA